jgi:hypothetical protein
LGHIPAFFGLSDQFLFQCGRPQRLIATLPGSTPLQKFPLALQMAARLSRPFVKFRCWRHFSPT